MPITITNIIPILIAFQGMLFAFYLFTDKGPKRVSNKMLAFFLIALAILFIVKISVLMESPLIRMRIAFDVLVLTFGPLLYLYTTSLIYEYFKFKPTYALHFLPSFILLLNIFVDYQPLWDMVRPLVYLSVFPYLFLAIREILKYRKVMVHTQSITRRTDLRWLSWTMVIFCFVVLFDFVEHFTTSLFVVTIPVVDMAVLIMINWMFYKGLKQPQIFLGISKIDEDIARGPIIEGMNEEDVKKETMEIIKFMEAERPFIDPNISLKNLAEELQMPTRKLSHMINRYFNKNFMCFINDYRLEFAEKRFKNPNDPRETISEVMYDVGFNSKSSFNTLFKEKTGLTPSEYKKKNRQEKF